MNEIYVDSIFKNAVSDYMRKNNYSKVHMDNGVIRLLPKYGRDYRVAIYKDSVLSLMAERSYEAAIYMMHNLAGGRKLGDGFKSAWSGSMILGYHPSCSLISRLVFWDVISKNDTSEFVELKLESGGDKVSLNFHAFTNLTAAAITNAFSEYVFEKWVVPDEYMSYADKLVAEKIGVGAYAAR